MKIYKNKIVKYVFNYLPTEREPCVLNSQKKPHDIPTNQSKWNSPCPEKQGFDFFSSAPGTVLQLDCENACSDHVLYRNVCPQDPIDCDVPRSRYLLEKDSQYLSRKD